MGMGSKKAAFLCRAIRESLLDEVIAEQWPKGSEPASLCGRRRSSALRRNTGCSSGTPKERRGAGAEQARGKEDELRAEDKEAGDPCIRPQAIVRALGLGP